MPKEPSELISSRPPEAITRRTFGQMVGAVATAGTLQLLSQDAASAMQVPQGPAPSPGTGDALCELGAVDLAARIRRKDVSSREVMAAHLARIGRINPKVNAIVTLVAGPRHG